MPCEPTKRCSCEDAGLHTPCPTCNPVNCPSPSPCGEFFNDACIIHMGYGIPSLGIEDGDSIAEILQLIAVFVNDPTCLLKAPKNLHPTSVTSTAIHLAWDIQGTPVDFTVEYSLDQMAWLANPAVGPTVTTDIIGNSLTPDTDYYIRVIMDDGVDQCESAVIKVKTLSA